MTPSAPQPAIDRVVVDDGAGPRDLTFNEFLSLPLALRVRCVIQRSVTFFSKGEEIDRKLALNDLRRRIATG